MTFVMHRRISLYRQCFAGFTIMALVLVIVGLGIFSDIFSGSEKISLSQPSSNLPRNQQPFRLLSSRGNRTFMKTSKRKQDSENGLQQEIYGSDLRKQQGIIEKVKADHRTSCSYQDFTDTEFIKDVHMKDVIYLPDKDKLQQLSRQELEILYHRYIDNIQHLCQRKVRLGNLIDGGWEVCEETEYRPKPPCIVYSFGIGNDFSFDDAVIKRYGCEVHSFDPTMKSDSYRRGPLSYFHATGIAGDTHVRSDGRELLTYESIRERLGHSQNKISIVKLDIELWELDALPNMLMSGSLRQVDNLAVEFHLDHIHGPVSPRKEAETYLKGLMILKDLYDNGFRIFWTRQNVGCPWFRSRCRGFTRTACQEVNYISLRVNRQ